MDGVLYKRSCTARLQCMQLKSGAAAGFRLPGIMLQSIPVGVVPCGPVPGARLHHGWGTGHAWQC